MPAPRVKPLNPDHQRLIEDLLADPTQAMCPICGERGFWNNRDSKPSPTSPDWKCKNKACVGATPMKRKSPYAVWLPEGYVSAPTASSKRLSGPAGPSAMYEPQDGPPAVHRESGVPDSPYGEGQLLGSPDMNRLLTEKRDLLAAAYAWAYDTAAAVQTEAHQERGYPAPDAQTIQNGAATLLIAADKRGAI